MKKVLLVVTSHDRLGNTGTPTGLYLPELVHPHEMLTSSGFEVDVASPRGGTAPIDPKSVTSEVERYAHLAEGTLALSDVEVGNYEAIVVIGGHGVMFDLPEDRHLQRVLSQAVTLGKVVGAVCHGPAALTSLKAPNGEPLVAGKRMTAFSNDEEEAIGKADEMPFPLETTLKRQGALYSKAQMWEAHVVVDGQLVTGQNPASARPLAETIVKLLSNR
jgi:putative intracellular protease/amidase